MRGPFIMIALFVTLAGEAQRSAFVIGYINSYKQLAIEEMIRTGVPASIKLAQGIHETEAGRSELVLKSNNHFGIKCKTGWQGEKVFHDDDARGECFRSYHSAVDSYMDHSDFLKRSQRYAFLFQLDPTDYKAWAYGLKKAGYATNIKYSQILIKIIDQYDLQQYSLIALGKIPAENDSWAITKKQVSEVTSTDSSDNYQVTNAEIQPVKINSYPSGEFTINKTRVVYARAGTSLLALADQYDIALSKILDFNDLEQEEVLVEEQLIFLQRKRKSGSAEFHITRPGESVYMISQAEGIRMESLLKYNLLEKNMQPALGEKLYLQMEAPERPRLVSMEGVQQKPFFVQEGKSGSLPVEKPVLHILHVVQPRETLFGIAKNYNTTADKIKEWNKLEGTHLKNGQELIIYKN